MHHPTNSSRSHRLEVLAVLGCFGLGFAVARQLGSGGVTGIGESSASQAKAHRIDAVDSTPIAAAEAWNDALAKYKGGTPPDLSAAHGIMAALLRMEAADFPASADGLLELFARDKENSSYQTNSKNLAEAWMGRWLEVDAPGALRFLETTQFLGKLPPGNIRTVMTDYWSYSEDSAFGLLTALSRKEPDWVERYIAGLPEGDAHDSAMMAYVRERTHDAADAVRRFASALPLGKERDKVEAVFVAEFSRLDPMGAFDFANAIEQKKRLTMLQSVIFNSGSRGVQMAKSLLDRITDNAERRRLASNALFATAPTGGTAFLPFLKEETARLALEEGEKADFSHATSAAVLAAVTGNPKEYADWAFGFAADKDGRILREISSNWARLSPKEFAAWAGEQARAADAAQLARLSAAIAQASLYTPAQRALAEALPSGALRDHVRFQIAMNAGTAGDIASAMEGYRSVAATDTKGTLASELANVLAAKNPASAAEWATAQPAGKARDEAMRVVAENWSMSDARGAAQWATSLPAGVERDRALSTYAKAVVVADPSAAAEWVGQIADSRLREQATVTVFKRWNIQAPVAARAWLHTQPEALAAKIMRTIQ